MTFDRPKPAGYHCRNYAYEPGEGPRCAWGIDLSTPRATLPCMATLTPGIYCDLREEHTEEERQAWQAWREKRMARMAQIVPLIPGSSRDKKNRPEWGKSGEFNCPACEGGKVRWARARVNGHVHAACSTPGCFGIME